MKRINWLDIAKFIFIMTVILEHLEAGADELSCFYTPYTMPAFLFVSGYAHRAGQEFKPFFIKKVRTLLVPWLILSVFDITLSQLVSFSDHNYLQELGWNFLQIRGKGDQLWFIAMLFVSYIPFYFFIEWYKSKSSEGNHRTALFLLLAFSLLYINIYYSSHMNAALLPWGTTSLPWHIDYTLKAVFYMFLGFFFREKFEVKFDSVNPVARTIVLLGIYIVVVYAPYFYSFSDGLFAFQANYVAPLLGLFAIISVCKHIRPNRYFLYVGQNTLLYFAFHGKCFGVIEGILRRFFAQPYYVILSNKISSIIFALILTVVVSLVLIIPCYIVNRWFPFILGKSKPAKTHN